MYRTKKFTSCIIGASLLIVFVVYVVHTGNVMDVESYSSGAVLRKTAAAPEEEPEVRSTLKELLGCHDKSLRQRYGQRGDFWVLYNYVPAVKSVSCADSITYTTHGDYTFLDNVETLLVRWQGPISLSIFAPGTDFNLSMSSIQYLRNCNPHGELIRDYVTFHLYFPNKHVPKVIPKIYNNSSLAYLGRFPYNCSKPPPWDTKAPSYRTTHKILYPVNVGRNVAREEATTYYVLASDIELYPNPGLIPDFLEMIRDSLETNTTTATAGHRPKVYPLSIFELKDKMQLPNNKTQLIALLKKGNAVPFHKHVCVNCHKVPKAEEWINQPQSPKLHVFHVGKRTGKFFHWEPIYIGTHAEPQYDERLSWEGKSDKMTQGYAMCVLDYEFHILNNAFLVHRPGIKVYHKDKERELHVKRTQVLIRSQIFPELKLLYGSLKGCTV